MEENKRYCFFGTIVMMALVGTLLIVYSGSPAQKDAVAHNKICQNLKEFGSNEYKNCQTALNSLVEHMVESKELDLDECEVDGTSVRCPVRVWYVVRHLVITSPAIVDQLTQINSQTADDATSPSRSKRAVTAKKNERNKFSNKCNERLEEAHTKGLCS